MTAGLKARTGTPGRRASLDARLAKALLAAVGSPPIGIALWSGESFAMQDTVAATLRIRDRATLLKLLLDPERNFGDAYMDGSVEVEGDLVQLMEAGFRARQRARLPAAAGRRLPRFLDRPRSNSLANSRQNIRHHYDLGNAFYRLWLDRELAYTCAYFPTPEATLEQAQVAKMDLVCRKLRLRAGETVVEAGCGWGAFALHAALRYGVSVRAFNISREQLAFARERAQALGAGDRVEFIEDDYRDITGRCDAFVSIGMLEHVGRDNYRELGRVIDRCLSQSGRGLIHSIGQDSSRPLNAWIEARIFPGAYPPTLREMMEVLEPWRFSVLDVENLRPHYALTLEHWLRRFEGAAEQVRAMYDDAFVRAWRFYLSGSLAAFRTGELQLYQVLFNRVGGNDVALTRDHLYGVAG